MMNRAAAVLFATCFLTTMAMAQTPPAPGHGIQPASLDTSTSACDDFFQFANGNWMKTSTIPAEYPSWGAFLEIYERNLVVLKGILEDAARNTSAPKGSLIQKVGDFYAAGMDEAAIEKAGTTPLASRFERIAAMKTPGDLAVELGRMHAEGLGGGFHTVVDVDDKNSSSYIFQLLQGGLGLPDRDYYTKDDASSKELRDKYVQHVARMLGLLGATPEAAATHAATVMAIETRLAMASMTMVEQRDPNAVYHKMTRAELATQAPGFDWAAYLHAAGLPASEPSLLVRQPQFFKELGAMTKDVPIRDWQTYLRWHLIHDTAAYLSAPFVAENFAFYGQTLSGTPEQQARWKRVQNNTDAAMGEALGQLYVEKAFSPEAKRKALDLVNNLRAALAEKIRTLAWMTEPTKGKALAKLDAFTVKIGYPDTWRDYSALSVDRQSYVLNVIAANTFESNRALAKLGKPIDRSEWGMSPPTVNAYYNPTMNEIVFPAGILQPPMFDPLADDAVNYGAIGMVIGHEMTHGFDDQGCQYDAKGNLNNWWTEADTKAYQASTDLVKQQAAAFEVMPGLKLNGELTLGENIADLGGLKIAFEALKMQW
ncbi:MAG TPA: M13 family metallopeptidase, partial [Thermoanaerobaculaceae bacterium]|nr:M13 family metallopeptidase [Thermoanaerobaculaceae bacterium]